eukprot:gi/632989056/ref/XP_007883441.1/ PREDICTED: uridine diphosphate glucose pyrophosphatase [Callorhinchus milii]
MDVLSHVELGACADSRFLRPLRVRYNQNGTNKSWDFMKSHDSVSILLFNTSRQCFILVKQFRPAVYMCECFRKGLLDVQEVTDSGLWEGVPVPSRLLPAVGGGHLRAVRGDHRQTGALGGRDRQRGAAGGVRLQRAGGASEEDHLLQVRCGGDGSQTDHVLR